jgi:lipoprotein-anchoring transpeptidase ErfK/SrfK
MENGIHALPETPGGQRLWGGYLGTPISFGCIVLGTEEARMLYEWARIGTPVSIRY